MFDGVHEQVARRRRVAADKSLRSREEYADQMLKSFLFDLATVFPDQIDHSIVQASVTDLSNAQLFTIQEAVGHLATAMQFDVPLLELIEARRHVGERGTGSASGGAHYPVNTE